MCARKYMFVDKSTFWLMLKWSKHAQKGQQEIFFFFNIPMVLIYKFCKKKFNPTTMRTSVKFDQKNSN